MPSLSTAEDVVVYSFRSFPNLDNITLNETEADKIYVRIYEPEYVFSGFRLHGDLRNSIRDMSGGFLHLLDVVDMQASVTHG